MRLIDRGAVWFVALLLAPLNAGAAPLPHWILFLDQSAQPPPFDERSRKLFRIKPSQEPGPTSVSVEVFDTKGFAAPHCDLLPQRYPESKYRGQNIGATAALGADAAKLGVHLQDQDQLWSTAPLVFTARLTGRALDGQTIDSSATAVDPVKPVFEWPQLRRYHISQAQMPVESEPLHREGIGWEADPGTALIIIVIIVGQAAVITWLLIERRRRRKAEEESHGYLEEVTRMNRAATVGALSSSIAHELYQPLGAILSNAEAADMLLKQNSPPIGEVKNIVSDIRADDQRAIEIMQLLRALLRKSELHKEDVDLNAILTAVVRIIEPEAKRRNIAVMDDRSSTPILVRADPVHLQQVILNLAVNAMDAMSGKEGHGILSFHSDVTGNSEIMVSVADNGTGIPQGELEAIFDAHFTRKSGGTGLGLYIARSIVQAYNGRIWAENRTGGGAVFRFVLPIALSESQPQEKTDVQSRVFQRSAT